LCDNNSISGKNCLTEIRSGKYLIIHFSEKRGKNQMIIKNGKVFQKDGSYKVTDLYVENGRIVASADIDGANAKQKFWYLTLPLLKPTTIYVITISVYAGLSMFLESFMLWNGNSSPKNIGLTIVGYLYKRGIEKNDMGYACAVGMVLLVIALAINVVQLVATGTFKKEEK
jgi:arabinosaccharide transport system permease protein